MSEKDINKIKELIDWRKKLKNVEGIVEDYYWKPLIDLLSKNQEETVDFLENCDAEELYWISEIFEDLSERFQSVSFVEVLKKLQDKYPDIDLKQDIQAAEYALD